MSRHVARSLRKLIRAYSDKPKNGEEDSCVLCRRTHMLLPSIRSFLAHVKTPQPPLPTVHCSHKVGKRDHITGLIERREWNISNIGETSPSTPRASENETFPRMGMKHNEERTKLSIVYVDRQPS